MLEAETASSPLRYWLIVLALAALALAPYLQTSRHEFVNYDDNLYVTDNRIVQQGLTWAGVQWAWTTFEGGNWHPLTWMSHMLDCTVFGPSRPAGHHLMNAGLHALNTLLLWLALLRMTGAVWRSALVAALFAVHPVHVESVAWVAERKDVLSSTFGLLAIWFYAGYVKHDSGRQYACMLMCYVLSLLVKPMLVTLPFLLILLDTWPLRRLHWLGIGNDVDVHHRSDDGADAGSIIREKLPLVALAIGFSVVAFIAQKSSKTMSSLEALPLASRVTNAIVAYATYLWNLLVPIDLAAFYPHPGSWPAWRVALSAAVLLVISLIAIAQRRQRPWLLVGWLWYAGMLVPVIGLVQVGAQALADRYMYLPAVGVFLMLVWSVPAAMSPDVRRLTVGIACAIIGALLLASFTQVAHWHDSKTLFTYVLSVTDRNFLAHENLGNALDRAGDVDGAMEHYAQALAIRPNYAPAHESMGVSLLQKSRPVDAMRELMVAISLDPTEATSYSALGVALMAQQRFGEAEPMLRRAVELSPDNFEARGNHGVALVRLQRWDEAIAELSAVARVYPQRVGVRTNLAAALAGAGRRSEAIAELQSVIKIAPNFQPAQITLRDLTAAAQPAGSQSQPASRP